MSIEIERKFLVRSNVWRSLPTERHTIRQGYLGVRSGFSFRVRILDETTATLTIRSGAPGLKRLEYEYEIPLGEACELLALCQGSVIEKERHQVEFDGRCWVIDVFHGENEGLVIAEVELGDVHEPHALPAWAGTEVTGKARYYNSSLVEHPFRSWSADDETDDDLSEDAHAS